MSRRGLLLAALTAPVLLAGRELSAQPAAVPAPLQAELFAKLAAYDRNFSGRASPVALVLLIVKKDDPKTRVFMSELNAALAKIDRVGALPHRELIVPFTNAAALAQLCRAQRAAAVYLPPGFSSELGSVRDALSGVDVMTLGAASEYVTEGTVLAFDLTSGRPKILVNLAQARKQNVNFKAEVLKLMKVYR